MGWRGGGLAGGGGAGVVAGVGEDGGDGAGGAGGDGGVDADLVFVFAVEELEVEGLVEGGLEAFGDAVEGAGDQGEGVDEAGVVVAGGGGVQGGECCLGGFAVGVEFGESLAAAGAHGLGGAVGGVGGEVFYLQDLGALGEVDAGEFFVQAGGLAVALLGGLGFGGGELLGE